MSIESLQSELEFAINSAPYETTDSDYDRWYSKADAVDNVLSRYNIQNPALSDQLKSKYLGEKPPNPSVLGQLAEGFIPGIKRSIADVGVGIGAQLSSPSLSAYQLAEQQGMFERGMSTEQRENIARKVAEDRAIEGFNKGIDPNTRNFVPLGIYEREEAGALGKFVGDALFDASKSYADRLAKEDRALGRAETKEEFLDRQKREGTLIDQLQAYPVEQGFVDPPGQLARSFGRSFGGQIVPLAVGGTIAGTGAVTRQPALVQAGLGIYRGGTPLATSGQVAGSMYDTIFNDDRIKSAVREQIESQYSPEQLVDPKTKSMIDRQVDRELRGHAKDVVGRTFQERLFSPQSLLEFAGAFPQGGIVTNLLANAGLEAGSEAFDSALEQTYVNRKLREIYRNQGFEDREIDNLVNYDEWLGKYQVSDAGEVGRGAVAGILLSGPTSLVESALPKDPRVKQGPLADREIQDIKDEASDVRNAINFERQVDLQEQKLRIEQEKTEQFRLKNQQQDTPIEEGDAPQFTPPEPTSPPMTRQEDTDVQELDDQMLNPDVINPLSPEQVQESQQQRVEDLRQEDLQRDADEALGVTPEGVMAPTTDQTQEQVQEQREELSDAIQQRLELQEFIAQNRETVANRTRVNEDAEGNATLSSVRSSLDSETEPIVNPTQEGGEPSILSPALEEDAETGAETQETPVFRNNRAVTESVVKLFKQRFPKLFQELGEINVLSNDEAESRGLNPKNTEGLYHKTGERRGDVDLFFENIYGYGDERRATDRLVEVLWHEAIGHKGLIEGLNTASKDGKGYDRFIDSFIEQSKNNEEFQAFINEPEIKGNERLGAEEFIVRKFAEGNVFDINDGTLVEQSLEGDFVRPAQNIRPLAQGVLENRFLDDLVASFKRAIGRDGMRKGRLDDKMIRNIMFNLKIKNMNSGRNIMSPSVQARTEQDEDMFLQEVDDIARDIALEEDDIFTQPDAEPEMLRSLGRNVNVRRAHNYAKQRLRWEFDVNDKTINVKATPARISEVMGGTSRTEIGTTFDSLVDTDPEFRQKVDSLGVDPSKPVYELDFERDRRYDTTGEGNQYDIFSGVAVAGRELMAKQPQTVMFRAEEKVENVPEDRPVAGRVRLYDRFAKGLAKEFGYDQVTHVYEGGLKGVYILNKQKRETLASRGRGVAPTRANAPRRRRRTQPAMPIAEMPKLKTVDATINQEQPLESKLPDKLRGQLDPNVRSKIIADELGPPPQESVFTPEEGEELLKSFLRGATSSKIKDLSFEYVDTFRGELFRGKADIEDIVGGIHFWEFKAGADLTLPRRAGLAYGDDARQEAEDAGFQLDKFVDQWDVTFQIDGSYDYDKRKVIDSNTGNEVSAKIEMPAMGAVREALMRLIDERRPGLITFSGAEVERVKVYDRGMRRIAEENDYAYISRGSDSSKSYYLMRKDLDDFPTVPTEADSNMSAIDMGIIERAIGGAQFLIDSIEGRYQSDGNLEGLYSEFEQELQNIDTSTFFGRGIEEGINDVRQRAQRIQSDLEQREASARAERSLEVAYELVAQLRTAGDISTFNLDSIEDVDTFQIPFSLSDQRAYTTFRQHLVKTGRLDEKDTSFDTELLQIIRNLRPVFADSQFLHRRTDEQLYSGADLITVEDIQAYADMNRLPSESPFPPLPEGQGPYQILSFVQRIAEGMAPEVSNGVYDGNDVRIVSLIETIGTMSDEQLASMQQSENIAFGEPENIVVQNIREFVADDNRVYDLNENFDQLLTGGTENIFEADQTDPINDPAQQPEISTGIEGERQTNEIESRGRADIINAINENLRSESSFNTSSTTLERLQLFYRNNTEENFNDLNDQDQRDVTYANYDLLTNNILDIFEEFDVNEFTDEGDLRQALIKSIKEDTSEFLQRRSLAEIERMGFTRNFSAWTKQIADAIERPEFSDFENLDNTILFGFIEGRGEARRTLRHQQSVQTLRSIRPGVELVQVMNKTNEDNTYESEFILPDSSRVEAYAVTSPFKESIEEKYSQPEFISKMSEQGINVRAKTAFWNLGFDRNGDIDVFGDAGHQHVVANGMKQYFDTLIRDKNPEGLWFSAYDPGLRRVGDSFQLNPDKIGARVRVYKMLAKQIGREYGYTPALFRSDLESGTFYLQRNDIVEGSDFSDLEQRFQEATGKQKTYEQLAIVRKNFEQLTMHDADHYKVLRERMNSKSREAIIEAYDAVPDFMTDGRSDVVVDAFIDDLRNYQPLKVSDTLLFSTVRGSNFNNQRDPDSMPIVEESANELQDPSGYGASGIGRWAHSVMNYLRGKQLGDLKDEDRYLIGRYKALGEIARMTEKGQDFYNIFKDAKNPKEIYDFLTTKGANPEMIPDRNERREAIRAKESIIQIGEDLRDLGLLKESTLQAMRGQYLPRIYLTHLLNDETVRTLQGGGRPTPSQLAYLKERKDIPKVVRELILREVKDPDYLVGRALMIPGRDIALMNWFRDIAENPDWAYQPSLTTFDTLTEVEKIVNTGEDAQTMLRLLELDPSVADRKAELKSRIAFVRKQIRQAKDKDIKKQLAQDLASLQEKLNLIKPRKVSGEYLIDEAGRLRRDIIPTLEGRLKTIGENLAKRMEELGKETTENVLYDARNWRKMPTNTKRFGQLKGMIVRREIYDDIVGTSKIIQDDSHGIYNDLFGDGGAVDRFNRFWKWAKVAGNFPASHVRNFVSNLSLMHLGGVPGYSIPGLLAKTIKEITSDGEHYKIAKKYGLKGSSFSANELGAMEKEFTELKRRLDKGQGNWLTGTMGATRRAFEGFREGTSSIYELMEAIGKTMMIIDGMNRMGLSETDAVLRAQKYLFDYSLLPSFARKIRTASLGAPFLTFYYKTLPILVETALKRPWKFAPYYGLGLALHTGAKTVMDIDDDEAEALRRSLPEFLREKMHVYMLPWKDENGRVQFFDASYLAPWGMFTELLNELSPINVRKLFNYADPFSKGEIESKSIEVGNAIRTLGLATGPVPSVITGVLTNTDPFTRRTIYNERDTGMEQLESIGLYGWNLSTPTLLAGLPDLALNTDQQRLQGGVRKLIGAMNGDLSNRGLPKDTINQSLARFGGINIYGFDPQQARQDSIRYGREGLKNAMQDMRIELRNMSRRKIDPKKIEKRRKELMKRVVEEQQKLRKYIKSTEKVANL